MVSYPDTFAPGTFCSDPKSDQNQIRSGLETNKGRHTPDRPGDLALFCGEARSADPSAPEAKRCSPETGVRQTTIPQSRGQLKKSKTVMRIWAFSKDIQHYRRGISNSKLSVPNGVTRI